MSVIVTISTPAGAVLRVLSPQDEPPSFQYVDDEEALDGFVDRVEEALRRAAAHWEQHLAYAFEGVRVYRVHEQLSTGAVVPMEGTFTFDPRRSIVRQGASDDKHVWTPEELAERYDLDVDLDEASSPTEDRLRSQYADEDEDVLKGVLAQHEYEITREREDAVMRRVVQEMVRYDKGEDLRRQEEPLPPREQQQQFLQAKEHLEMAIHCIKEATRGTPAHPRARFWTISRLQRVLDPKEPASLQDLQQMLGGRERGHPF